MPTLDEITTPIAGILVPVPRVEVGICRICHGVPGPGYPQCASCHRITHEVSHPVRVVPISLMTKSPGQLYDTLKNYKSSYSQATRNLHSTRCVGLIGRFLRDHGACIDPAGIGTFDFVTTVPSTREDRQDQRHALSRALDRHKRLNNWDVLARGSATPPARHADDNLFRVTEEVAGMRCVLVDDTYTTGAHAQSAASALTLAGADVVAIVPIGRLITPDWSDETREFWKNAPKRFDFDDCCVHDS